VDELHAKSIGRTALSGLWRTVGIHQTRHRRALHSTAMRLLLCRLCCGDAPNARKRQWLAFLGSSRISAGHARCSPKPASQDGRSAYLPCGVPPQRTTLGHSWARAGAADVAGGEPLWRRPAGAAGGATGVTGNIPCLAQRGRRWWTGAAANTHTALVTGWARKFKHTMTAVLHCWRAHTLPRRA